MDIDTIKLYEKRCREIKSFFKANSATGEMLEYYGMINCYEYFKDILSYDQYKDILKHKVSRRKKRYRANKKLTKLMDYKINNELNKQLLVFTTLTLSNDTLYLKSGRPKKLRTITKKVDRYINQVYDYAIVNVDYGEKTERLHFHLIGILKKDTELIENKVKSNKGFKMYSIKDDINDLGYSTVEVIDEDDNRKVTNYLLKINNHSNKPSTKNHRIRVLGNRNLIEDIEYYQYFLERLMTLK